VSHGRCLMGQRRTLGPLSLSSPIGKLIQCHRHCKEHGGERFDPITPSWSPKRRCTCKCI
jgi:hypothetical protein